MALPLPEPPLEPPGQVIQGDFGNGSPGQLIPVEGRPMFYHSSPLPISPTWGHVWHWITDHFPHGDISGGTSIADSIVNITTGIENRISVVVSALSGFINLSIDYTATVAHELGLVNELLLHMIEGMGTALESNILDLQHIVSASVRSLENELHNDVNMLEGRIANTAQGVIHLLQVWSVENIFAPLEEQLGNVRGELTHLIDAKTALALGAAEAFTLGHILPLEHELTQLRTQVAALEQENQDCTQPMCETMGPKTNLGKLLKGLNLAADAALIAELARMDEAQLVALINTISAKLGTLVNDVETSFFAGGETIAATITGEISKGLFG